MKVAETAGWNSKFLIKKYENEAAFKLGAHYSESEFGPNILLNVGIGELLDLLIGAAGTAQFNNANARIGVGDSTTAAAATQTALQAPTNAAYQGMEATYPSRSGQTITFRSVFAGGDANYAWQEFIVDNGVAGAVTLNRRVENQGTKVNGQVWTVDVQITIS